MQERVLLGGWITKGLLSAAIILPVVPATSAQPTKEEVRLINKVMRQASALTIDKCELNDGKKGWLRPNRDPVGDLPIYRCTAEDNFDGKSATFTQIPDGSVTKEAVEFCTFSDYYVKCESVPVDRPAGRTEDLAKFGIKERQFEPIVCNNTSEWQEFSTWSTRPCYRNDVDGPEGDRFFSRGL
jgi:hypothetical protein